MPFNDLPTDLWLSVMSFLDYKDLTSLSFVNKDLNRLTKHDLLWRRLCKYHWFLQSRSENYTWKAHFVELFADLGQYIDCYRPLKIAWDKFEKFLVDHCPRLHRSLNAGASEKNLNGFEKIVGKKLPRDLRCSYRIHDGQVNFEKGIFGTVSMPNHRRSDSLFCMSHMGRSHDRIEQVPDLIPITYCIYTGFSHYVCLRAFNDLQVNHIYCPTKDNVLSQELFITGKNFTSWFTEHVDNVIRRHFSVVDEDIIRFYHDPNCVLRTGSIKVSVATCFLPEFSTINPPNFMHTYRITMEMDEDAPPSDSCRLETRHWIMVNENNDEERVDGRGVVGEFPTMRPGATFTWISCTTFNTTYGFMKGHFVMRKFSTGNCIQVECPTFHMKCLPHIH